MPKAIKVGVNQWATLDRSVDDAELMTADLAGCVAIAVRTQDKIGLTHVFNGAIKDRKLDEAHWDNVVAFMSKFGAPENIQELHLIRNHPLGVPELPESLAPQLKTLLVSRGLVDPQSIYMHTDSGCAIARNAFYLRQNDDQAIYDCGPTNTRLRKLDSETRSRLNGHFETGNYQGVEHYTEFEVRDKPSNIEHDAAAMAGPGVVKAPTNASSRKLKLFDDDSDDDAHSFAPEKTRRDSSMSTTSEFRGSNSNRRRDIEDDDFFLPVPSKGSGGDAHRRRGVEDEEPSHDKRGGATNVSQNKKKRMREDEHPEPAAERDDRDRSNPRGHRASSSSNDHADAQEPAKKKAKRPPEIADLLAKLPMEHAFSKLPRDAAAEAILAFAQKQGIHRITDLQPLQGAIMAHGIDQSGRSVKPQDALRAEEVKHYLTSAQSEPPTPQLQQNPVFRNK